MILLLGNETKLSPFVGFMGGASDNHMTAGHVTFQEANSSLSGHRHQSVRNSFLSSPVSKKHECKFSSENFLYTRKLLVFNHCY